MIKVVIIGAGSVSFGRNMIVDLLRAEHLQGKGLQVWLVDLHQPALEKMHRFAELVKTQMGSDAEIHATSERARALPGASYVVTAVSVRRYELWEQDFRVPLSHGFRHCLGENGGPGALFHSLRSLELMMPICHDIETLCPDALLLNFTNPEARVLDAVLHLTRVKAVGLCHGVFRAIRFISHYLDLPMETLEVTSAGMNHFYTILKVVEKKTGQDLFPGLMKKLASDNGFPPCGRSSSTSRVGLHTLPMITLGNMSALARNSAASSGPMVWKADRWGNPAQAPTLSWMRISAESLWMTTP
jgi:alpha-galactosidase